MQRKEALSLTGDYWLTGQVLPFFQFTKLSGIWREHMLNHLVYSKNVQTDALFSLH